MTDIAAKAVGGPNYLPLPTVDGVEDNDKAYPAAFPFLASPHDGVTRVHENRWRPPGGRGRPAAGPSTEPIARRANSVVSEERSSVDASQDRRLLVAAIALVLAIAGTASAHPLGNFTVNHYAGIELAGDRVYVRYVLDLAEIPTFQFGDDVRAPASRRPSRGSLELRLDGRRVALRPVAHRVVARDGAGGPDAPVRRRLLGAGDRRLAVVRRPRLPVADRLARDHDLARATAPGSSTRPSRREPLDELRAYPGDLLRSPLDVRSAARSVRAGHRPRSGAGARARLPPAPIAAAASRR